jgi:hypothetical protein
MYEGFLLITLVLLVLVALRSGNKVLYEQPLLFHQPGCYHATLAPQLGRIQAFLEQVAKHLVETGESDVPTLYFEIHDGIGQYLLAAGMRSRTVYFQAIMPPVAGSSYKTLATFSAQVMVNIPISVSTDVRDVALLHATIKFFAERSNIACSELQEQ